MSSYRYETENLEFSWGNDGSVLFRSKDRNVLDRGVTIRNVEDLQLYCLDGESIALRIPDFKNQDQSLATKIITLFVPIVKNHLRTEIVEGLRYYKIAEHYKLMVPQDVAKVKLEALRKDYNNIIEKYPLYLEELSEMEVKATANHIHEPLVATTGLLVYATLNMTWFIWETLEQAEGVPEYLNQVDGKKPGAFTTYVSNKFKNTQSACVDFVMSEQVDTYGMSISDLVRKRNNADVLLKNINDLEVILKIPKAERWEERNKEPVEVQNVDTALKFYNDSLNA